MLQLKRLVQSRKLTQAKAAKLFGVTQPRISDLVRGKIDRFSVDMLISMLARAGMSVRVTVRPNAAWPARTGTVPATRTPRTSG